MRVEVVYALAHIQEIEVLEMVEGAAARQAVEASGLIGRHGLAAGGLVLGMAGRRVAPERRLLDGDRVEILRKLALDPKEARRLRVRRARKPR